MVIHGVDNMNFPVFSTSKLTRDSHLNFHNAGGPVVPKETCPSAAQSRRPGRHEDNTPKHHHLGVFCPASGTGCGLYRCTVHECRCWFLVNTSSLLTFIVVLFAISICYAVRVRMLRPSDDFTGAGMSVSEILKTNEVSDEIRRQLRILDHAHLGVCEWKESKNCKGLPNIAAVDLGAFIASTYDTVPYGLSNCGQSGSGGLCEKACAETILKPDVVVGRNFNFKGEGRVLIKLPGNAIISGFTLHHPHKDLLPIGTAEAAPKDFEVQGYYCEDAKPFLFGKYRYILTSSAAQAFPIQNYLKTPVNLIEVTFLTNHGNSKYTAVYSFEVHGDIIRDE